MVEDVVSETAVLGNLGAAVDISVVGVIAVSRAAIASADVSEPGVTVVLGADVDVVSEAGFIVVLGADAVVVSEAGVVVAEAAVDVSEVGVTVVLGAAV